MPTDKIEVPAAVVDARDARIAELEKKNADLTKKLKEAKTEPVAAPPASLPSNAVFLDGVQYEIHGTFRADNTFSEVKRGHCEEGVTLVAISRPH